MNKILVVEDDYAISTLLKYNLEKNNYLVDIVSDGKSALISQNEKKYDLLILDIMLPQLDGISVTKKLRNQSDDVSILMLTALSTKKNIIRGLNSGADDYVVKPFSSDEILARVAALLRRKGPKLKKNSGFALEENILTTPEGKVEKLTRKESELFDYLHRNTGIILNREQILLNVWPLDADSSGRSVDIQISHLRDKIEEDSKNPKYLLTVRGFGYKLEEPNEE